MNQQDTRRIARTACLAPALFGAVLFIGCGQEAPNTGDTASDATAAAYEALSAKLQACQDEDQTCTTAAAGDQTKLDACKTADKACHEKTRGDEDRAKRGLGDAAHGCMRGHEHCDSDEDAGTKGQCRPERHRCMQPRMPHTPGCLDALLACLEKKAGPGSADAGVTACVDEAHTCMMGQMPMHGPGAGGPRGPTGGKGDPANSGAAGHPTKPVKPEPAHAGAPGSTSWGPRAGAGGGRR